MADRSFQSPKSNILNEIRYSVLLQGQGAGKAPKLGIGDPSATWFNQPVFVSTGLWTIQTVDGFFAVADVKLSPVQASAAGTLTVFEQSLTAPDSTTTPEVNQVTVNVGTFVSGTLADLGTTDYVRLQLVLINSGADYNTVDAGGDD